MTTALINPAPGTDVLAAGQKALAKALNAALATKKVHVDNGATGTAKYSITAADGAGTLAGVIALTIDILNCVRNHGHDNWSSRGATGSSAHKVVDETLSSTITVASVVSLATVYTALNAIKAWYETHRASTTYHGVADATNTIAAADATTQGSADTLANELKADINAHLALALVDLPVVQAL